LAFKLATVWTGVSVPKGDAIGAGVSVGRVMAVDVRVVGMGIKVVVRGMLVDVSTITGEGDAVGLPLLKLQARAVAIIGMRKKLLIFMSSLYLESIRELIALK